MEKEKQVDACIEPLKKLAELNFKRNDLIRERKEKEAEFKAYLREQDKEINAVIEKQHMLGQVAIDIDIKSSGYLRDAVKNCIELSGMQVFENKVVSDKGIIHTEMYKGFVESNDRNFGTKIIYGENIDELLDKAGAFTNKSPEYTTVNIGTLNPLEGGYGDFHKFDIIKRYDVTDIQLSLPYLDKSDFTELTKQLKAEGAKFNSYIKRWYITYEMADKECFQPYISETPRQRDYCRQRLYTLQELALPVGITGKTVNDMLSRYDGYVRITYEDNGRGRIVPKAEFYQNETPEDTQTTGSWLPDKKVRTVLVGGNEMNKDILYCGEGYQIKPEGQIVPHTRKAAIVKEEDATGKYYSIYGIHDLSGMICRLSPRRFDTKELAETNIPKDYKYVFLSDLQREQTLYGNAWSTFIRDDAKECGFELSDYAVKNIKLLNYETNRNWTLKQISKVYAQINDSNAKLPENLSERACGYIKKIGNECAYMQKLALEAREAQP